MDSGSEEITNLFLHKGWITSISLVIVLALLLHVIVNRFYRKVYPQVEKSHFSWDSALLKALLFPLKVLIWILALNFSIQLISYHFDHHTLNAIFKPFRDLAFVFTALWLTLRFIKNMEDECFFRERRGKKKKYDKTTVRAVCQIARVSAIILASLAFLQTRNVNISAVLAFGGAGGLIIGFAAKDLLANFFGGLMIYFDRPFSVGDLIKSSDKEIEGHVENIGWRLTRIRTLDRRPLYVPNGLFSNICVQNSSRMSNRRIRTHVGVRYCDVKKIALIVAEIDQMLKTHEELDKEKPLICRFDEFGSSSLNILIYCFTKKTAFSDYTLIQQEIFLETIAIIEKNGAECAFPTTTLHIPDPLKLQTNE